MDHDVAKGGASSVTIRVMRPDDIAAAHELRALAGWNQTERDWRGYLAYEPNGCFVAEVAGRTAGTATTIRHGDIVGWIGMVLVHPDQRRHGVGSHLLRHAIRYLQQSGVRSVKLDATPLGKKVYVPLGFADEYELSRYEVISAEPPDGAGARGKFEIGPYANADAAAAVALDAAGFGVARPGVLAELSGRDPELCFMARHVTGEVCGLLIARRGERAVQVGPWTARDPEAAEQLLRALLAGVAGRTVFIDVPAPNGAGAALMRKYGFGVQRTLTRMFLGENTSPGEPRLVYSISSPEKG